MKRFLSLFLVLGLVFGVAACSSDSDDSKKDDNKEEAKKEEKKVPTIGDTVEVEGIKITVNSTRISTGSDISKPDEGMEWIVLDITLENTTDEALSSSSLLSYTLKDGDGRKQDIEIFADLNGSLDTEVEAGGKATGEIAFSTKPGSSLTLTYKPGFGDSVQIKIR